MELPRINPATDLAIVMPVYNDWDAAGMLLERIARELPADAGTARILLIDDGSTTAPPTEIAFPGVERFERVDVLLLRRNLGHQRALAIGLCHVEANVPCKTVLVMDSDGEDDPADIAKLLAKAKAEGGRSVVFAERTKRSESLAFRFFYGLYRGLHLLLTGIAVRVGNFSALPFPLLRRLVAVSDLWNHYAAAIFRSRIPYVLVPTVRASRLAGKPHMNFVALVLHGLSAISVFGDRVGVRMLIGTVVAFIATFGAIVATIAIRLFTDWAIPGWATNTVGLLVLLLVQLSFFLAMFLFGVLGGREGATFLPLRDYAYFIAGSRCLHGA